jgi:hypothetical protein
MAYDGTPSVVLTPGFLHLFALLRFLEPRKINSLGVSSKI